MFGHEYLGIETGHSRSVCSFRYTTSSSTRLESFIFTAVCVLKLQVHEVGAIRDGASRCQIRKNCGHQRPLDARFCSNLANTSSVMVRPHNVEGVEQEVWVGESKYRVAATFPLPVWPPAAL